VALRVVAVVALVQTRGERRGEEGMIDEVDMEVEVARVEDLEEELVVNTEVVAVVVVVTVVEEVFEEERGEDQRDHDHKPPNICPLNQNASNTDCNLKYVMGGTWRSLCTLQNGTKS
jgi:hypothetical protein